MRNAVARTTDGEGVQRGIGPAHRGVDDGFQRHEGHLLLDPRLPLDRRLDAGEFDAPESRKTLRDSTGRREGSSRATGVRPGTRGPQRPPEETVATMGSGGADPSLPTPA